MEKKRKHNPNPHKLPRLDLSNNSWSELPLDLLNPVFERLSFPKFQRAKSVCSSWHTASRQSMPKNLQVPWLILFLEEDDNNSNACTLFNLEEKDKLYKTKDLGVQVAKSVCKATSGSWFLMQDLGLNIYIVNLFTKERIDLPPVESQLGTTKLERTVDDWFIISNNHAQPQEGRLNIRYSGFWIDEKTKDYIILWGLCEWCVVYAKKEDTSWNQLPKTTEFCTMAYKDHKLYFLSYLGSFKIFDFSKETFLCLNKSELGRQLHQRSIPKRATKLVVTLTGDVLKVKIMLLRLPGSIFWSFRLCKVYSSGLTKKYEEVDSLGDEAMLFDLDITVLVNDTNGFKRNSIYFSGIDDSLNKSKTEICLFNLETQKVEPLMQRFDCSSPQQLARARWFLPSFMQT